MSHQEILSERFLRCDLTLHKSHTLISEVDINDRIKVALYNDSPMYLAIIFIDGQPRLREEMISEREPYASQLLADDGFIEFLYEYSKSGGRAS